MYKLIYPYIEYTIKSNNEIITTITSFDNDFILIFILSELKIIIEVIIVVMYVAVPICAPIAK